MKISYKSRVYESVDDKSLSLAIPKNMTKNNVWVYKLNLDYSLLKIVTKCSSILSEETNKTHFTGKPYLTEIFSVYFKTLIDLLYIKAYKIVPEPPKRLIVLRMQFCESGIAYDIN